MNTEEIAVNTAAQLIAKHGFEMKDLSSLQVIMECRGEVEKEVRRLTNLYKYEGIPR